MPIPGKNETKKNHLCVKISSLKRSFFLPKFICLFSAWAKEYKILNVWYFVYMEHQYLLSLSEDVLEHHTG